MKRILMAILGIYTCIFGYTQERCIHLNLFGQPALVGILFETNLHSSTSAKFITGIGYGTEVHNSSATNTKKKEQLYSIPVAINYLTKGEKHKLEMGIGICNGIEIASMQSYTQPSSSGSSFQHQESMYKGSAFCTLGYRMHKGNGLIFRAGINPSIDLFKQEDCQLFHLAPYISIGFKL